VVAGVAVLLLAGVFVGDAVGLLVLGHILSALFLFPGAVILNFVAHRLLPARTWIGDIRRPRLAGWLSVPLIWGLVTISALLEMEPARFLNDQLGSIGAWLVHGAGLIFVGSSLSLVLGWALPPKPAVRIRRPSLPARRP
jgi:hypothetical protein